MRVRYNSPIGPIEVPNSYKDLTLEQLRAVQANKDNLIKVVEILTGLNAVQLAMIDLEGIAVHFDFLHTAIIDSVEPSREIKIGAKIYSLPEDIKAKSYGQKIAALMRAKKADAVGALYVYLYEPVTGLDFPLKDLERLEDLYELVKKEDVYSIYGAAKYVVDQLAQIEKREDTMLKSKITPEQIEAGIKNFSMLGEWNNIHTLAGRDVTKHDTILLTEYNEIFNTLLFNNLSSNFERRYYDIMSRKK